jgi:hypothetical protein
LGEILVCDRTGAHNNQLHHSTIGNSDTSRNITDLPARFNPGLTEIQQIPRPLKEQFVNNLSIGQFQRSVFHSGFKGFEEFEGTPQAGMTRDVCLRTLFQGEDIDFLRGCFEHAFTLCHATSELWRKGAGLFKALTHLYDHHHKDEKELLSKRRVV